MTQEPSRESCPVCRSWLNAGGGEHPRARASGLIWFNPGLASFCTYAGSSEPALGTESVDVQLKWGGWTVGGARGRQRLGEGEVQDVQVTIQVAAFS